MKKLRKVIINKIAIIFVTTIDNISLLKKTYSGEFLSCKASSIFQKLSVGIISSMYFGAIQLFTK
ncbi:MAG: hypothetical protein LBQ24_01845 [Candidatus Peribacteria bacterium]|jgi:hypothetical protein|nr:hypothetical protein [Candidatus Peribacteria bacterium]